MPGRQDYRGGREQRGEALPYEQVRDSSVVGEDGVGLAPGRSAAPSAPRAQSRRTLDRRLGSLLHREFPELRPRQDLRSVLAQRSLRLVGVLMPFLLSSVTASRESLRLRSFAGNDATKRSWRSTMGRLPRREMVEWHMGPSPQPPDTTLMGLSANERGVGCRVDHVATNRKEPDTRSVAWEPPARFRVHEPQRAAGCGRCVGSGGLR